MVPTCVGEGGGRRDGLGSHGPRHGSASRGANAYDGENSEKSKTELDEGGDGCVTLAITTCKRIRAFMGTVEGLKVRFFYFRSKSVRIQFCA